MKKPLLFAGPSVYGLGPGALDAVDLRPPAACGDLLRAVRAGTRVIGLVDGLFENAPAVWHKEILVALAEGVTVFGAASMGALRAAECSAFGMIGVGVVFEAYRSGARDADADVALLHGPAELGYMPLTEALVDVDGVLDSLRERALDGECAARLAAAARRIHFTRRTWTDIVATAELPPEAGVDVLSAVARLGFSQKRDDARDLLAAMGARSQAEQPRARLSDREFNRTLFLTALEERIRGRSAAVAD